MDSKSKIEVLISEALFAKEANNVHQAISELEEAVSSHIENEQIRNTLAECYIEAGETAKAEKVIFESEQLIGKTMSSDCNRVRLLLKKNDLSGALTAATQLEEDFPGSPEVALLKAACLRINGKIQESLEYLLGARWDNALNAEALINRGLCYLSQGEKHNAIIDLEAAYLLKPHLKKIWVLIVGLKADLHQHSEMVSLLIKMMRTDPAHDWTFEILNNLCKDTVDHGVLITGYKTALALRPNDTATLINLGFLATQAGDFATGENSLREALKAMPDSAEIRRFLGICLRRAGKNRESIQQLQTALAIRPNYPEALNDLGSSMTAEGLFDEGGSAYNRALSIKPNYAEAHYNLGNCLIKQNLLEMAVAAYQRAIDIKPDYAQAHNNLGVTHEKQGMLDDAIVAYANAICIDLDFTEAQSNFVNCLSGYKFKQPDPRFTKVLNILLDQKAAVSPRIIAPAVITLLAHEEGIKELLSYAAERELGLHLQKIVQSLTSIPLLIKLMSVCPLPDIKLEAAFTDLRSHILSAVMSANERLETNLIEFLSALALQCFANDYIYNTSARDNEKIKDLEKKISRELSNGRQPSPQEILCLASYKPLIAYEWCQKLRLNHEIRKVLTRHVLEPTEERGIIRFIPTLEEVTDEISLKVREQYEQNPYPRWVNLDLRIQPRPIHSIVSLLGLKLYDENIKNIKNPYILIAGCGTGQHSLETATRFKDSKVLGVDLSLRSLAYAQRKTKDFGVKNIEYMQADILDTRKLNRKFDIIESSGVLHHMREPLKAWQVLKDALKMGGLMKVALYSELARKEIVEIREEIRKSRIGMSDLEMKSLRSKMMKLNKNSNNVIFSSSDFFSLSEFRDLLFHVQEHRFTISQIKSCINKLGLKFCGFENDLILKAFKLQFRKTEDLYNLDRWQEYEDLYPKTFTGMYQFWCQKVD